MNGSLRMPCGWKLIRCCAGLVGTLLLAALPGEAGPASGPLTVDRDNPRYFADATGRAVFLTGSHTWANIQERGIEGTTPDFDFVQYLDFLVAHHHNFTRLWSWQHAQWMAFAAADTPIRYKPLPYRRTGPGLARDGKPKFDLHRWNEAYFQRLRERVRAAGDRGIYVCVMLFNGWEIDQRNKQQQQRGNAWLGHPYHRDNNISGIDGNPGGNDSGREIYTLEVPEVTRLQEAFVGKMIETVNDCDNVIFEICNEGHALSGPWQRHMIDVVRACEAKLPRRHLVGMTGWPIKRPELMASSADWIAPPVHANQYEKLAANDGTKISVIDTDHVDPLRSDYTRPWRCFLQGHHFLLMDNYRDVRYGAPSRPDPVFEAERQAMGVVRQLADRVDLVRLQPRPELASTGYCLANPGVQYVVFRPDESSEPVEVELPAGDYQAEWILPVTGDSRGRRTVTATGEKVRLESPTAGPVVLLLSASRPATQ